MDTAVHTLAEFEAEATRFASSLTPSGDSATLITLSGELGAGKTAFTKAVARAFNVEEVVTSPTFVLEKIYPLSPNSTFKNLIHIDTYRLEKGADLLPLDFDALMKDPGNLVFLEWPERVVDALPVPAVHLNISVLPDKSRRISYD
jgi:tRNA threonylcarbamoyl adenosine modification protein YjeE